MSQQNSTQETAQEAAEAAGALQFISRVMARTQERLGDFAAIGIWWGTLTVLAILASLLLGFSGHSTTGRLTALWVAHNVIGWSATLIIVGRAGGMSPTVHQVCWVWAATNAALWVVIWAALWTEALAPWALWTMIQLLIGLALLSTGLIERERLVIGAGLLFVGSVPVILAFPRSAALASAILMGSVYALFGLVSWAQRRKTRDAS